MWENELLKFVCVIYVNLVHFLSLFTRTRQFKAHVDQINVCEMGSVINYPGLELGAQTPTRLACPAAWAPHMGTSYRPCWNDWLCSHMSKSFASCRITSSYEVVTQMCPETGDCWKLTLKMKNRQFWLLTVMSNNERELKGICLRVKLYYVWD